APWSRLAAPPAIIAGASAYGGRLVGQCDGTPAPATSPITFASLAGRRAGGARAPPLSCVNGVLDVAVEVEAPGAALAADAGQPGAAERRGQVADEEAVDPDGPGDQPRRHPLRPG